VQDLFNNQAFGVSAHKGSPIGIIRRLSRFNTSLLLVAVAALASVAVAAALAATGHLP
jgi:hypothetical protein